MNVQHLRKAEMLIQFKDREKLITNRSDVIVISDEAHRTQSNTFIFVLAKTYTLQYAEKAVAVSLLPQLFRL